MKKSKFQFKKPVIRKMSIVAHSSWEYKLEYQMDIDVRVHIYLKNETDCEIPLSKLKNEAIVSVEMCIGSKNEALSPFYMEIEMAAQFKWDEDVKNVEMFLKGNAPALLISYIRPNVAMLTAQLGIPAYHLPFIDLTDCVPSEE